MSESFKDTPTSLAEHRAFKDGDCTKWTPRDLLVHMLREMDAGRLKVGGMLVLWHEDVPDDEDLFASKLRRANLGTRQSVAMLEIAKFDLLKI